MPPIMKKNIVLASASPRRLALLQAACFDVEVRPAHADETWPAGSIEEGAITVARRKLEHLAAAGTTLAADTVVVADGHVLGKPADAAEARRILRRLSGVEHQVITGFVLRRGTAEHAEAVVTRVWFRALSDAEIDRYVATGESLDKAGAYGIQGEGCSLVERIEGSYTNVVGLPLAEVLRAIAALEV